MSGATFDFKLFQSTPPVKAATISSALAMLVSMPFQSTPPVKAATMMYLDENGNEIISIHAAREGGDVAASAATASTETISIHAAREGGDAARRSCPTVVLYFNPRRP